MESIHTLNIDSTVKVQMDGLSGNILCYIYIYTTQTPHRHNHTCVKRLIIPKIEIVEQYFSKIAPPKIGEKER